MTDDLTVVTLKDLRAERAEAERHGVLRVARVASGGAYVRQAPHEIDTTFLEAERHAHVAKQFEALRQSIDPLLCFTLRDASVAGQGSLITCGGGLLRATVSEFLAMHQAPHGFEAVGEDRYRLTLTSQRRIERPSLLLKRPWWRNFGHWLVDAAALLALASRLPLPAGWQIVIGKQPSERMRQVVADTIQALAPGVKVEQHPDDEVWRFDRLLYVPPVYGPPLFKHPEGLASLRAALLRDSLTLPAGHRMLFVSRADHPARRLTNEADLVNIAAAKGYEVVRPETLRLAEQARLFHSARRIVGVKGAAMTSLLFCPGGGAALMLSPADFTDPFFWDVASHAGLRYSELFGKITGSGRGPGSNAFEIDPERFASMLP